MKQGTSVYRFVHEISLMAILALASIFLTGCDFQNPTTNTLSEVSLTEEPITPSIDGSYPAPSDQKGSSTLTPWPTWTPLPTPTEKPGPTDTPFPLPERAKDSEGEIVFMVNTVKEGLGNIYGFDVDAQGKLKTRLVKYPIDEFPSFKSYLSPDGRYLLSCNEWKYCGLFDLQTNSRLEMVEGDEIRNLYGWHPDNQRMLLNVSMDLWIYDVFNQNKIPLDLHREGDIGGASISPNGAYVVYSFVTPEPELLSSVRLIESNGRNARQLFEDKGRIHNFAWSPDGKKIAFMRDNELKLMNLDGTDLRILPYVSKDGYSHTPVWSPDSQVLLINKTPAPWSDEGGEIYWIDVEGGEVRSLLNGEMKGSNPVWSPDGTQVVFAVNSPRGGEIWSIAADGSSLLQLLQLDFDANVENILGWINPQD